MEMVTGRTWGKGPRCEVRAGKGCTEREEL